MIDDESRQLGNLVRPGTNAVESGLEIGIGLLDLRCEIRSEAAAAISS